MKHKYDDEDLEKKIRLAIIDDEPRLLSSLSKGFSNMGLEVMPYLMSRKHADPDKDKESSRKDISDLLERFDPDVILTDHLMPCMSGVDITRASIEYDPSIAILVMSGKVPREGAQEEIDAGAYNYLQKPITDLEDHAKKFIRHGLRRRKIKKAENDALKKEQEYSRIFNNAPIGIFITNSGGEVIDVNPRMAEIVGCKNPEEAIAKFTNLANQLYADPERRKDFIRELKEKGHVENFEYEAISNDEKNIWISMNASVRDRSEDYFLIDGFALDITEKKKAEQELKKERNLLFNIIDNIPDIIYVKDIDARFVHINKAHAEILGLEDPEDALGLTDFSFHPYEMAKKYLDDDLRVLSGKPIYNSLEELCIPGNSKMIVSTTKVPLKNREGEIYGIVGINRDMTERIEAEKRRSESQKRLEDILRTVPIGISELDTEGRYTFVNDSYKSLFGYSSEEILGNYVSMFSVDKEEEKKLLSLIKDLAISEREPFTWKGKNRKKDGSIADVSVEWRYKKDDCGKITGFVTSVTDITEKEKAEKEVRKSEAKFRTYIENSPNAAFVCDAHGNYIDVNPAACSLLGYEKEELLSMNLNAVSDPDSLEANLERFKLLLKGESISHESKLLKKDNKKIPVLINAVKLDNDRYLAKCTDLTHVKELEQQILQSEKLSSIGELAGGIAHDFNNQLAGIMGYAELISGVLDSPEEIRPEEREKLLKYARSIAGSAKNSADLTRQMLDFARKSEQLKKILDIEELVNNVGNLLERSIYKGIEIKKHFDSKYRKINADEGNIESAILNLGVNARDAIGENYGEIVFFTRDIKPDEAESLNLGSKRYICIGVKDDGEGISKNAINKIFDPFFTTKETGKGTGLGLAGAYGTVKAHEGDIRVESEPGKGTTFKVYLPIYDSVKEKEQEKEKDTLYSGKGAVHIVDDEPSVKGFMSDFLSDLGYDVSVSENGDDALEFYREDPCSVDLFILDMNMPGMNGIDLYDRLMEINPDVNAIIATGYAENFDSTKAKERGIREVIRKPIPAAELSRIVKMYI